MLLASNVDFIHSFALWQICKPKYLLLLLHPFLGKPLKISIMYAIVNIAGQQFKVQKDQTIIVHRLSGNEGDTIQLKDVVLADDGKKVKLGADNLKNASISAKILGHLR